MRKPRVVIRSFTCRRDVAPAMLLARLLEHKGCEVLITCVRDYTRTVRHWRPEVAVTNTPGKATPTKKLSPETRVVFLDGEGFQPTHGSRALWWLNNPKEFNKTDVALVWGEKIVQEVRALSPNTDIGKLHVVGNPTYDLIRYLPNEVRYDPGSQSIGVVARFHSINDQLGIPPIRTLPNEGNLERIIVQCQAFNGIISSIRQLLKETDFKISIRPHPLEQVDSYKSYKDLWFGHDASRVEIDDSLCFADWAVRQRAIVSPTSTSLIEAYLLDVPVINSDVIASTERFNRDWAEVAADWQAAGNVAQDLDHLVRLVTTDLPEVAPDAAVERQLVDYCDFGDPRSACLRAAEHIAELAHSVPKPKGLRMPTWAAEWMDSVSFRRNMKRNALHANMNYRRGYHRPPAHLDGIESRVLQGEPSRGIPAPHPPALAEHAVD